MILLIKKIWPSILLAISAWVLLIAIVLPSSKKITHGFAAYYTASWLAVQGRGGSILYDDIAFQAEVERLTHGEASDIYWANPPTTALMLVPLATLSITDARRIWMSISLFSLFLSSAILVFVISEGPLTTNSIYVATAVLFLSVPVTQNFQYGQAYLLLLAFYAIALFALHFGFNWVAGLFLGLTVALKASGLPLLVLLLMHRKWRAVVGTLLVLGALAFSSISLVGFSPWKIYLFDALPDFLSDPAVSVTAYQTVPGFLRHLFTFHPTWNPNPLVDWPVFSSVVGVFIALSLVGIVGLRARRTSLEWLFCMGLILSVILVPAAEQHHYVLLFPAFLLGLQSRTVPKAPLFAAAALVALSLNYTVQALAYGWWALLAYPRLYGAILLLLALFCYKTDQKSQGSEAAHVDAFSRAE
jgi:arabinofuranan 3-O-arabinosyltransferase